MARWPFWLATDKGVAPSFIARVGSAPCSSSTLTTARRPISLAAKRAVKRGAERAVHFSKVAGCDAIEAQLRALHAALPPRAGAGAEPRHVHVFGHSHRPKDVSIAGVRYVHAPLAYPQEREFTPALAHPRDVRAKCPPPALKRVWSCQLEGACAGEHEIRRYASAE